MEIGVCNYSAEGLVPDVGRAIYLNQLYPEVETDRRMENLERQRKETYAIREIWKTLQQRRPNKERMTTSRDALSSHSAHELGRRCRSVFKTNNGSGPFIEQYKQEALQEEEHGRGSLTDRGYYRDSARSNDNASGFRRSRGNLSAREVESAPSRLRRIVRDEDIPYHTMITMPPDRRSKTCVGFNALNQKLNCRLPNVYDTGYRPPGYTKCDIREWKNEIKKIVPRRPELFLPASTPLRPLSTLIPPEMERPRDTSVMFRPTRNRTYGKHIEYMVDPEWFSENITPESVQRRAHCVYTWNI